MTPAEQCVLDAARAYRDNAKKRYEVYARHRDALLYAALALPRTWPPPTVTDNPAEVVQGEVRWDNRTTLEVIAFSSEGTPRVRFRLGSRAYSGEVSALLLAAMPLVSRPGVTL